METPIQYPSIVAGGKTYQLRISHTAFFLLQRWGYEPSNPDAEPVPIPVWACAGAGSVDLAGAWHSAGFKKPYDLIDSMTVGEKTGSFVGPVNEALEKVAREVATLAPAPAQEVPAAS